MAAPTPVTTPTTPTSPTSSAMADLAILPTQAPMTVDPMRPSGVVYHLSFASETVKRLTADDFDLTSRELIALKYDDCILVLFYAQNTESSQLVNIWSVAAQQVAGPIFAGVNMIAERKVSEAFTRLKSDGSNPLHWAGLRQFPFILVYRKRWPVAVYNGPREVQAIIDYALTLACQAGYYEITQLGGSMQAEARLEMGPYDVYSNIPGAPPRVRTESIEFSATEPIRGFNSKLPVVITGSTGAQAALGVVRKEEQAQQVAGAQQIATSLTEGAEAAPTVSEATGEPIPSSPPLQQPSPVAVPATTQPTIPVPATIPR